MNLKVAMKSQATVTALVKVDFTASCGISYAAWRPTSAATCGRTRPYCSPLLPESSHVPAQRHRMTMDNGRVNISTSVHGQLHSFSCRKTASEVRSSYLPLGSSALSDAPCVMLEGKYAPTFIFGFLRLPSYEALG